MNKEMVELVEEIAKEIEGYGDVEFDYITHTEAAVSSETLAQRIIALIGKAYTDGLELPKEIERHHPQEYLDRGHFRYGAPLVEDYEFQRFLNREWMKDMVAKGVKTFIALRGKEMK